ncbi:hypothetical protein CY34DRAFT_16110 [Suillus luteus UH-Slu-Lm8-n1]|uniref:Uncharacterized protein n=1 Tax=Suillus luteus UH-Slu-Lm8-n1 TaxID=930992 RepID=A0A0D0ARC4_9AGAM|nr:hypothetical protein CY34DRAFT_16110 [Suillus luteus UH-Slu-Lm8-n1]
MAPSIIPSINNTSTSRGLPSFQQESKFASDMKSRKTNQGGPVQTMPSQPHLSPYQIPPPIDPLTSLSTWYTLAPALDQFSNLPLSSSVPSLSLAIGKCKGNSRTKTTLKQSEVAASSQGRDKWVDPKSDLLPTRIMSWKLAMEKADKLLARVHPPSAIWHGFLDSIPNPDEVFSSSTASSHQLNEAMDLFGTELMQLLTWHDIMVTSDTLRVEHICQVLWDLAEHNFHFELLTLDKQMASEAWNADSATWEDMVLCVFNGGAGFVLGSELFLNQRRGLGAL